MGRPGVTLVSDVHGDSPRARGDARDEDERRSWCRRTGRHRRHHRWARWRQPLAQHRLQRELALPTSGRAGQAERVPHTAALPRPLHRRDRAGRWRPGLSAPRLPTQAAGPPNAPGRCGSAPTRTEAHGPAGALPVPWPDPGTWCGRGATRSELTLSTPSARPDSLPRPGSTTGGAAAHVGIPAISVRSWLQRASATSEAPAPARPRARPRSHRRTDDPTVPPPGDMHEAVVRAVNAAIGRSGPGSAP